MELQFIEMGKVKRETGLRGRNNWFCFRRGQFEILVTCLCRHGIVYTNELKSLGSDTHVDVEMLFQDHLRIDRGDD